VIPTPCTSRRYLRRTPNEPQAQMAEFSSERISPHHRVTRPQSLCLGKAIQSQSRVHLCNAVVGVRHQLPATPALASQSRSFALLRPQSSPARQIRTLPSRDLDVANLSACKCGRHLVLLRGRSQIMDFHPAHVETAMPGTRSIGCALNHDQGRGLFRIFIFYHLSGFHNELHVL
jgi:hypothetical protein